MAELISNLLETSLILSLIFISMYCLVNIFLPSKSKLETKKKVKFIPCKDFYLEETNLIDCTCEYDNCLEEEYDDSDIIY